ncbi:MAG: ABC transporter permease [Prevotellaceae bacterium]|jgi:lipoprotein-releasing system permease protein|nr:ABC transporter permease [Prevotellaceae bacterium]
MNFEYYIAKRIHFENAGNRSVARPAVRIAIAGIAVGLTVMMVAVCVVIGFKTEIREKMIGFGGHVQITNFDNNNSYEMQPIQMDNALIEQIEQLDGVRAVQHFATTHGIVKTDNEFQGIVLKGVGEDFDWDFFRKNLVEGQVINTADSLTNKVIVSQTLCNLLGLKLGDAFFTYFIQEEMRVRKFTVSGIYNTGFSDYDKLFVLADIRHIQRLNGWEADVFGGLEVLLNGFDNIDQAGDEIYSITANHFDAEGKTYYTRTIKQMNPQIFSWLALLDTNVWVILMLMLAVAGFSMVAGLLILILERTAMIGLLKSLGDTNRSIRKIFLYHSLFLILKGMFWGNLIGLTLCAVQYFTHIIPMPDKEAYYVAYVPIYFNWALITLLNVGTLLLSILIMIAPSYLVTKISPAKTMRYE